MHGRIKEAKLHFRRALETFPGDAMAARSLENLEIVEKSQNAENCRSTRIPTG